MTMFSKNFGGACPPPGYAYVTSFESRYDMLKQ